LPDTATEILVEWKPPPQPLFADSNPKTGRANYLRFRVSPDCATALAVRVKTVGKEFVGQQCELYLHESFPNQEPPYERLLSDAMSGDGALFTREDAVEAAWAVVEPVLKKHPRVRFYKPGTWGPKAADSVLEPGTQWHNPRPSAEPESDGQP
jgi:glucose-6-phosphate 1-dehydrogenase